MRRLLGALMSFVLLALLFPAVPDRLAAQQASGISGIGFFEILTPPRTFLAVAAQRRKDGSGTGHVIYSPIPGTHINGRVFQVQEVTSNQWCVAAQDMDVSTLSHVFCIYDLGDGRTTFDQVGTVTLTFPAGCPVCPLPTATVVDGDYKAH
jgi:hypothetical protein